MGGHRRLHVGRWLNRADTAGPDVRSKRTGHAVEVCVRDDAARWACEPRSPVTGRGLPGCRRLCATAPRPQRALESGQQRSTAVRTRPRRSAEESHDRRSATTQLGQPRTALFRSGHRPSLPRSSPFRPRADLHTTTPGRSRPLEPGRPAVPARYTQRHRSQHRLTLQAGQGYLPDNHRWLHARVSPGTAGSCAPWENPTSSFRTASRPPRQSPCCPRRARPSDVPATPRR